MHVGSETDDVTLFAYLCTPCPTEIPICCKGLVVVQQRIHKCGEESRTLVILKAEDDRDCFQIFDDVVIIIIMMWL